MSTVSFNQLLTLNSTFVSYNIASSSVLPAINPSQLKAYWLAENGVFLRGKRFGIDALIHLCALNIPGLAKLEPYFNFSLPPVPKHLLRTMLKLSVAAGREEILFYLAFTRGSWQLSIPDQIATEYSVAPTNALDPSHESAIIEVHSHHSMRAEFSVLDDREEKGKFRIFAVLGEIFTRPTINVRLGIYNHFQILPPSSVFQLPLGIFDANRFIL